MYHMGCAPGELPDYVIVGLGNPGKRYEDTRHNIGFKVVDYLDECSYLSYGCKRLLHSSLTDKCVLEGNVIYLVKPQTYMNNSGIAVQDVMRYYKLRTDKLIVIQDDITLHAGHFKIVNGGDAGGHNGVKSIIQYMKTKEFARIKVGVGRKPPEWQVSDYVLSRFSSKEYEVISSKFEIIKDIVGCIMNYSVEEAMEKYNPLGRKR